MGHMETMARVSQMVTGGLTTMDTGKSIRNRSGRVAASLAAVGLLTLGGCTAGHFTALDPAFSPVAYDGCVAKPDRHLDKYDKSHYTTEEGCYRYAKGQGTIAMGQANPHMISILH